MGFIPAPTEGILCVWSLQKDFSGEYMGMDISFRKKLFYGKFERVNKDFLKLIALGHAIMHIKKEKLNCDAYISCIDTIKLFDSKNFLKLQNVVNLEIQTVEEKAIKVIRWITFEKRLPQIILWDENMWGSQYEILK